MIRTDGKVKFYQIKAQYLNDKRKKEWFLHSDYFAPELKKQNPKKGLDDCFTASGKCWQQTGQHGVFKLKHAREGLRRAQKDYSKNLRLGIIRKDGAVKLAISQINITQSQIQIS